MRHARSSVLHATQSFQPLKLIFLQLESIEPVARRRAVMALAMAATIVHM